MYVIIQSMLLNILLLVIGFVLLIRGADAFIDGASALARRFNIPEIIIGLSIVAFGTSAPEAAVSISSVLQGASGVAVGNVLGSNIVNILLILGVSSVIAPLAVQKKTIQYEIPFVIFITIMLMWIGIRYGAITRSGAAVLCLCFVLFLGYLYFSAKKEIVNATKTPEMSMTKILVYIVIGACALVLGSDLTVDSSVKLAEILHVPNRIIGLSLVAFGTSLPELVTCIVAARKKRVGLILGNIIGSNIFNILFVLGITGLIAPIKFDYAFTTDTAISVVITTILWLITIYGHKLTRSVGIFFLVCYVGYLGYLI